MTLNLIFCLGSIEPAGLNGDFNKVVKKDTIAQKVTTCIKLQMAIPKFTVDINEFFKRIKVLIVKLSMSFLHVEIKLIRRFKLGLGLTFAARIAILYCLGGLGIPAPVLEEY